MSKNHVDFSNTGDLPIYKDEPSTSPAMSDIETKLRGENPEEYTVVDRLRCYSAMPDTFQFEPDDAVELDDLIIEAADTIAALRNERDTLEDYARKATATITELVGGGSECFAGRIGEMYKADLEFCKQRIRERESRAHERFAKATTENAALRKQVSDAVGEWREITEEDRPPNDVEVLMGCWESWPRQQWVVEYGIYGSTKGGWIHGRMTHWLPSSILPVPPLATLTGGKADA